MWKPDLGQYSREGNNWIYLLPGLPWDTFFVWLFIKSLTDFFIDNPKENILYKVSWNSLPWAYATMYQTMANRNQEEKNEAAKLRMVQCQVAPIIEVKKSFRYLQGMPLEGIVQWGCHFFGFIRMTDVSPIME